MSDKLTVEMIDRRIADLEASGCLPPHRQRVMDERDELSFKLGKLLEFTRTTTFSDLDAPEKSRLNRQVQHMSDYRGVLNERIAAFQTEPTEAATTGAGNATSLSDLLKKIGQLGPGEDASPIYRLGFFKGCIAAADIVKAALPLDQRAPAKTSGTVVLDNIGNYKSNW